MGSIFMSGTSWACWNIMQSSASRGFHISGIETAGIRFWNDVELNYP